MKSLVSLTALCASLLLSNSAIAQRGGGPPPPGVGDREMEPPPPQPVTTVVDPITKIQFNSYDLLVRSSAGVSQVGSIGMVLPQKLDKNEYIGHLIAWNVEGGWTGISHQGGMINSLLLALWLDSKNNTVHTFRTTTVYDNPQVYYGKAQFVELSKRIINSTSWAITYKCIGCFALDTGRNRAEFRGEESFRVIGWAQSMGFGRMNRDDPNTGNFTFHDGGQDIFPTDPRQLASANYDRWAAIKN